MSKNYALEAETRDRAGKGVARALRREDKTPAVIYGDKKEPINIALPANDLNVEYNKGHMFTMLCEMMIEGEKHVVLARDIQLHPVTDVVIHADFLRVTKKTQIAVEVPVNFINEDKSPGLKDGGVLNVVRYEIELYCSAMEIPESVEVDLAGAETGDTIKLSNITLPDGTKPVIDDRDFSIATIAAPKRIEEDDVPEGEEGAEEGEFAEGAEGESADDAKGEDASE